MSQQLQQLLPQLQKPSSSPDRTSRPAPQRTFKLIFAALALTGLLLGIATLYISAYEVIARNEYQRQRLAGQIDRLVRENLQFRLALDSSLAQPRLAAQAGQAGMKLANPDQFDFVQLPSAAPGSGRSSPTLALNARQAVLAMVRSSPWQGSVAEASQR